MSRFRSRASLKPGLGLTVRNYGTTDCSVTPSWSDGSAGVTIAYGDYKTMVDTVTPGFYTKMKRGEYVFNDMFQRSVSVPIYRGDGLWYRHRTAQCVGLPSEYKPEARYIGPLLARSDFMPFSLDPSLGGLPVPSVDLFGQDRNSIIDEVVTSCLAKRGSISNSNLYESAIEINKTLTLLEDILDNGQKVLSRKLRALNRVKNLASAYLAYRYGVRPLIMDVHEVMVGLERRLGKQKIRSRENSSIVRTSSLNYDWGLNSYITYNFGRVNSHELSIRALSVDEVDISRLQTIGLGSKELQTVAWELLPYSFVSDWFANIGDYIQTLAYLDGVTQLGSSLTIMDTVSSEVVTLGTKSDYHDIIAPMTSSVKTTLVTKSRASRLPGASLVIRNHFGFDRMTRLLDAFALITQKVDSLERVIRKLK